MNSESVMQKKITIKTFLNKKLASKKNVLGEIDYPVYYQITYNRKNTQIKSAFNIYVDDLENANSTQNSEIQIEIATIHKIIDLESENLGNSFSLQGLKNKHTFYLTTVEKIVQKFLMITLQKAINQANNEYQNILKIENNDANVVLLYKACKELMDNIGKFLPDDFKFEIDVLKALTKHQKRNLIVADWMETSTQLQLKEDFITYFENTKTADSAIKWIEKIIHQHWKYLF